MKKSLIFLLLVSFFLGGCFAPSQLQQQMQNANKYNYSHKLVGEDITESNTFNDGKIKVVFSVGIKQIEFSMFNLTTNPIKIIWDETALILFAESKRVFHKGVNYAERNNSQPPTLIAPKSVVDDLVAPSEYAYFRKGYYVNAFANQPSGWESYPLFYSSDMGDDQTRNIILALKGHRYRLFMPIEIDGVRKNYTFEFEITEVNQLPKN